MKNKRLFFLLILVLIIILISLYFVIKNFKAKNSTDENNAYSEYTPQEEISSKQMRETTVSLYFVDSDNNIKSEGKLIDSANLLQNPYKQLIELLLSGPQSDNLTSSFPENTKLLNSSLEGECLILDFSSELLNYNKEDSKEKENLINSIVNTVTELNEVNKVKLLINGQINEEFKDDYVRK